jgi:hypothetical protein
MQWEDTLLEQQAKSHMSQAFLKPNHITRSIGLGVQREITTSQPASELASSSP